MAIETGLLLEQRYEVTRALRSGGMGAVYLATDRRLANTPCAIKEILEHRLAGNDAAYLKERFEKEMAALATLDHPGIPRVRDYFQREQSFYIVMDYIDGQSLDYELAEALQVTGRPLEPEVVAATALQILEILAYLHNLRPPIIHRDVKPSNLLRETRSGRVKLVDFGLAKEVDKHSQTMVGTPGYCAIEQMSGKAGPRSDIYSLGVTMHQLLCGQTPRVLNLAPLREVMPDFRPELAAIVERACAQHADDRYQDAESMLADLRRWLQGESARNGVVMPVARIEGGGPVVSNGQAREVAPARMSYSEPAPSTATLVQPSSTPAWVWGAGMVATLLIGVLGTRMMMLPPSSRANAPVPVMSPGAVVLPPEPAVKPILVADAGAAAGLRVATALAPPPVTRTAPAPAEPPVVAARPAVRPQLKEANDYPSYPTARRKDRPHEEEQQQAPAAYQALTPEPAVADQGQQASYPTRGGGGGYFQEMAPSAYLACPPRGLQPIYNGGGYQAPDGLSVGVKSFLFQGSETQARQLAKEQWRTMVHFGGGASSHEKWDESRGELCLPVVIQWGGYKPHYGGVHMFFKTAHDGVHVLVLGIKDEVGGALSPQRAKELIRLFSCR